jgi:hypothetical protein
VDPFNTGQYEVRVVDPDSGAVLYSKGYDCIFGEYRTTSKAAAGTVRAFRESALVPFPKHPPHRQIMHRFRLLVTVPTMPNRPTSLPKRCGISASSWMSG